tara:strand:- start:182 stop:295 length:114 start_codon:yes stop_codon:yes gene_type:complete
MRARAQNGGFRRTFDHYPYYKLQEEKTNIQDGLAGLF